MTREMRIGKMDKEDLLRTCAYSSKVEEIDFVNDLFIIVPFVYAIIILNIASFVKLFILCPKWFILSPVRKRKREHHRNDRDFPSQ